MAALPLDHSRIGRSSTLGSRDYHVSPLGAATSTLRGFSFNTPSLRAMVAVAERAGASRVTDGGGERGTRMQHRPAGDTRCAVLLYHRVAEDSTDPLGLN